jgi:adenylosuccinate lyase
LRHRERIAQLRERVLVGEFAGAAGTLASWKPAPWKPRPACAPNWA